MHRKPEEATASSEKILDYFPVILFIVLIFIFELLHLPKPTALLISTFLSFFSFLIITAAVRLRYRRPNMLQPLYPILGWLSILLLFILMNVMLYWFHVVEFTLHWIILLVSILIYFVLLFRVIHLSQEIRKRFSTLKT